MTPSAPLRLILPSLLLCLTVCLLSGCVKKQTQPAYDITLHSDFSDQDSATIELFAVDTIYNALRKLGHCTLRRGDTFRFQGKTIQDEQLAFLRLASDTVPYYFILDHNPVDVRLSRNAISLRGGNQHFHEYVKTRNIVRHLLNLRSSLRIKYHQHIADSTLTADTEQAIISQYSALEDSIHCFVSRALDTPSQPKRYLVMRKLGQYAPSK